MCGCWQRCKKNNVEARSCRMRILTQHDHLSGSSDESSPACECGHYDYAGSRCGIAAPHTAQTERWIRLERRNVGGIDRSCPEQQPAQSVALEGEPCGQSNRSFSCT